MGKDFIASGIISAMLLISMLPAANAGGVCCNATTRLALLQISRYHAEINNSGEELNKDSEKDHKKTPPQIPVLSDIQQDNLNKTFFHDSLLKERIKLREIHNSQPLLHGFHALVSTQISNISHESKAVVFHQFKNNSYAMKHFQTALL
ncbi:MAG: hypothetical protein GY750_10820 [Lentisphaerae bacterium]|nr:hypothetical protein [Lentisphaerota bacterium]MCP4101903.1 hypothetical protein [Lentisphaerota bacterium]